MAAKYREIDLKSQVLYKVICPECGKTLDEIIDRPSDLIDKYECMCGEKLEVKSRREIGGKNKRGWDTKFLMERVIALTEVEPCSIRGLSTKTEANRKTITKVVENLRVSGRLKLNKKSQWAWTKFQRSEEESFLRDKYGEE